jgi:ribosomal protein S18 acetylase RimI-like enzyme
MPVQTNTIIREVTPCKTIVSLKEQGYGMRNATPSDALAVQRLADSLDISRVDDIEKQGFLAAQYTAADYRSFIENSDISLIIEHDDGEVVGFLVAYTSERVERKDEFNMNIKKNINDHFLAVRQVFVSAMKEHRRKGLASQLYRELYRRILQDYCHEDRERCVYADIVKTPINVPSRDFHWKHGFEIVGEFTRSRDNRAIYIFCNSNVASSLKELELRMLGDRQSDSSKL